jgi:hypothetical protein
MENTEEPSSLTDVLTDLPVPRPEAKRPAPGMKAFGKHALWIYGVLVGLAIRECLLGINNHNRATARRYEEFTEVIRAIAFLFVIIRFYLGAAVFFEKVHGESANLGRYPPEYKRFGVDFFMGFMHFLVFFAWSVQLVSHSIGRFGVSPPYAMLIVVLTYDVIWLVVSSNYATRNDIGEWTAMNVLSVAASVASFAAVGGAYSLIVPDFPINEHAREVASNSAELVAMIPIFAFGFYDFRLLIEDDTRTVPRFLRKFVKVFEWDHFYPGGPRDPDAA